MASTPLKRIVATSIQVEIDDWDGSSLGELAERNLERSYREVAVNTDAET